MKNRRSSRVDKVLSRGWEGVEDGGGRGNGIFIPVEKIIRGPKFNLTGAKKGVF